MASDKLLDHLEKIFGDAYRKEVDQEENVWRTLPFFAATLALQVAALGSLREWIAMASGPWFAAAAVLLLCAAGATFFALIFLAASVWPANYRRLTSEPELMAYAFRLKAHETARATPALSSEALTDHIVDEFKRTLIEQYSIAANENRQITVSRTRWRARAGLSALVSVTTVLALVALSLASYLRHHG